MKARFFSILLSIFMLLSLFTSPAAAQQTAHTAYQAQSANELTLSPITLSASRINTEQEVEAKTLINPAAFEPGGLIPYWVNWDWGDGITTAGYVITEDDYQTFNAIGTHTYGQIGQFAIVATVTKIDDGSIYTSEPVMVEVYVENEMSFDAHSTTYSQNPVLYNTEIYTGLPFYERADNQTHTATWDWGDGAGSEGTVDEINHWISGTHTYTIPGIYTPQVTLRDSQGHSLSGTCNPIIVEGNWVIGYGWSTSSNPLPLQNELTTTVHITDTNPNETHTIKWEWDDGTSSMGIVKSDGSEWIGTGTHKYAKPGVYNIKGRICDSDGDNYYFGMDMLIVVDPKGPTAAGAGEFSPPHPYGNHEDLDGKTLFAFSAHYLPHTTKLAGQVYIYFKSFNKVMLSDKLEWLVCAGNIFYLKGTGHIDGIGQVNFRIDGLDASHSKPAGIDKIRIVVMTLPGAAGEFFSYDSQGGSPYFDPPNITLTKGEIIIK